MTVLIVVENPKFWPLQLPGAEIVPAREYLTDRRYVELRRVKVFNLCRSYSYQSLGYYVSLLAQARGHKPMPSVTTIQDLRHSALVRITSEEIEDSLQRLLKPIKSPRFELSIYFGRNMVSRYDRLCQALFSHFPAPLLRAEFVRVDQWRLNSLRPIATSDIPDSHRAFLVEQAERFFDRPRVAGRRRPRYDLAILYNEDEIDGPSDEVAHRRFARAAKKYGIRTSMIDKAEYGRIAEYDALFIRETTAVNHHTYRFARRAEAEGLVVIDDPESIVRCGNKVFQAEIFEKHHIPCPKTLILSEMNAAEAGQRLGFPCVLKKPDASFGSGVKKAHDEAELAALLDAFFEDTELVVAQEYVPSSFDWRIGVLGGKALFACKYYMAKGHWQVQVAVGPKRRAYGKVDTMKVEDAPQGAVDAAVRAARPIGSGLYGVDVKEVDGRFLVMEVNDNPNIQSGFEDAVLKDRLYDALARWYFERLEARNHARNGDPP